jgi:acyl dehydratase
MPLDPGAIRAIDFPVTEHRVEERDCMLYSLSLGLGRREPGDWGLTYCYERGLEVFPTQALTIGHPRDWMTPETGITRARVVHGGQKLVMNAPLRPGMVVLSASRVGAIVDKGEGRGAIIVLERTLADKADGTVLATMEWSIFCRGDGGFGGEPETGSRFREMPARAPDWQADLTTGSDAALLYRLNGDTNPIHADPELARKTGFEMPILHGLCLFGMSAASVMRQGKRSLRMIEARFASPAFPGEPLALQVWSEAGEIAFAVSASARNKMVMDQGRMQFT